MQKAKQIDTVRNSIHSEEEVQRRLPEVDAIHDDDIRSKTVRYFIDACPDYFWEKAASASGKYHPKDERGEYGTWLHTKRVFYEYCSLSESLLELHEITEFERECGKAAALIHDTFNYGWPSEAGGMTTQEHDIIAAAVANYVIDMPEEVVHLVHSHMGPWGEGKEPETMNERCFHLADKSSAADNHTQGVYYPAEELQSIETVVEVEPEDS
jgi:hypothetical protein